MHDFYSKQPARQGLALYPGIVAEVSDSTVTFRYRWGSHDLAKTLPVSQDMTVYSQGQQDMLSNVRVGDTVVFAIAPAVAQDEGRNPVDDASEVQSIFKTQTDTHEAPGASKKGFYTDNNIMPLDWHNQIDK